MSLLTVSAAHDTILARVPSPQTESVAIESAAGRVLMEPVFADRDYPPINRATMDGIALSSTSWNAGSRTWSIESTVPAGVAAPVLRDPHTGCVKIMTGGEVPSDCDGIIPFEQVDLTDGIASARADTVFQQGQFIHVRASDRRTGDRLLEPGQKLDAPRLAILAAVGHTPVTVARFPRVAVISTGNEIVPVLQRMLTPVQSRASNALGLAASLQLVGIANPTTIHIVDDLNATTAAIARALAEHDIVILTGGVSKGHYDFVPAALKQCGVAEIFHGVSQKPGKPFWFGQTDKATVFGLPGNPVSTLTVFRRFVVPFLTAMTGSKPAATVPVNLARPVKPHVTLTLFPPVRRIDHRTVEPVEYHGSGDFAALAESDGFLEILPGMTTQENLPFWAW